MLNKRALYVQLRQQGMSHEAARLDVQIVALMRETRAMSDIPALAAGPREDRSEWIGAACDRLAKMRESEK